MYLCELSRYEGIDFPTDFYIFRNLMKFNITHFIVQEMKRQFFSANSFIFSVLRSDA